MNKLTIICAALALLGTAAGCGGSQTESAWQKEFKRVKVSACRSKVFNTPPCGAEMQKVCEAAIGSGPHEPEGRKDTCELASQIRTQIEKNEGKAEHTPEEEAAHNKSLEPYGATTNKKRMPSKR